MTRLSKFGIWVGGIMACLVVLAIVAIVFLKVFCVTFVDNYEFAFSYDKLTGKIEPIESSGWVIRTPIRYVVHTIDLRPKQISISANSRILNAKLVRFNPAGLDKFIEWHGRNAGDSAYQLEEILKSYAFDTANGKDCPFLTVVSEIGVSQTPDK